MIPGALALVLLLETVPPAEPPAPAQKSGIGYFDVHRTLGTVALGSFASALVLGSVTGNLSKLMDENRCCPDGGMRNQVWRGVDRTLVTVGIISYSGAAAMALYNLTIRQRPRDPAAFDVHRPHRWLALAHGAAFATSAVTGLVMFTSQDSNPSRFATAARIHTASNVLLVPLLTAALSNILFE